MEIETPDPRIQRKIAELYETDEEFAAARPIDAVAAVVDNPETRLPQLLQTVMEGYADRPALGQRAVEYVTDPQTGRTSTRLLPRYVHITYRQLWQRAGAICAALSAERLAPGERVAVLGSTGVDYTVTDIALMRLGAVAVPLPTSAPVDQLQPIFAETEPVMLAASISSLAEAVELVLAGPAPARLVVFDDDPRVDEHREAIQAAAATLAGAGSPTLVCTLADVIRRGEQLPEVPLFASPEEDPLTLLVYTSGSTGAPKGAMYPERLVANAWRQSVRLQWAQTGVVPSIVLNYLPMSHMMGRVVLYNALGNGGTAYFAAKSDLSTLPEDLALVRPTQLSVVPRICDMLYALFRAAADRRIAAGADAASAEAEATAELADHVIGGRVVSAGSGSAPTSPEMQAWVESLMGFHVIDAYGSTETGAVLVDGHVRRPPVRDYKLVDLPELGYFGTDRPHPRGELLLTSDDMFAGYYKRPDVTAKVFDEDGYYRTGDIVAELAPDHLVYVDRCNNVLKLSQGEFVAVSTLEGAFGHSPLVRQIYIYGNSARPYLLAVIVPAADAMSRHEPGRLKALISESLQTIAKTAGLQPYEIPRDFLVETTPFSMENGLLTGARKLARPQLRKRYGVALEQLYTDLADGQADELSELRRSGAHAPVLETVTRAAGALLGSIAADVPADAHFTDLGGDSLSALTFADLLRDIFDVDVPVGVITSPATDLAALAEYIATERAGSGRATFASVHGRDATEVHAHDLTLDKFLDATTLAAAPSLPGPSPEVRTVLLTGATGFLGRYLALQWLERMDVVGGTVICLVRGKSGDDARRRLDETFDSGDPHLLRHYRRLAAEHLEVLAGDKGQPNLGLAQADWQRLADTVDVIVDPAALVNHVLPYGQLFGPNVGGTAELIRLALSTRLKPFAFVSTVGVGLGVTPGAFTEDADIRDISATRAVDDSYANGYANSKWAGEVLLREVHDLCGLPVAVFRCDMILAETRYAGQLNVPDAFTRLMLSLVATGIAPASFYELDSDGNRQRSHYDGLPVDFIAESIATLGAQTSEAFTTYHVMNPHDDGIGLDQYVDWLVEAGYPLHRVGDYGAWLQRFEIKLRALPERQRRASVLPLLHSYRHPAQPLRGSIAPTDQFRKAVQDAGIGPEKDIPSVTMQTIVTYVSDLELLGLL